MILPQTQDPPRASGLPELDERERASFSVVRAINVALGNVRGTTLERSYHDAAARSLPPGFARGIVVPIDLLPFGEPRAELNTGLLSAGKALVFTRPAGWIEALFAKSVLLTMGAQWWTDVPLPAALPRQTSTDEAEWVPEVPGSDLGDVDASYDQVRFAATGVKTAAATTGYSRQLLQQSQGSRSVEAFVRDDLGARTMGAWDRAALTGTGNDDPLGLLKTPGLPTVVVADPDGGVPAWADIVALETTVAAASAELGPRGYVTTPAMRELLKTTERATGSGFIWEGGQMNGYPAEASTRVPANLTKGGGTNLHAIIYGAWRQMVLATIGVLDLVVDPVRLKKQGLIEVTSYSYGDVQFLQLPAFAAIVDGALS